MSAPMASGRHDSAQRRKSQRRGRERGCWVYLASEQLAHAGVPLEAPAPLYRVWAGHRGRFVVTLYPAGS